MLNDMTYQNSIGPQIIKLRQQRRWTHQVLAKKLQIAGLSISKISLKMMEERLIKATDYEVFYFSYVFNVKVYDLFPLIDSRDPDLHCQLMHSMKGQT